MTAYHATHPSPYADDCADCTGMADPAPATTRWGWPPIVLVLAAVAVALVWRLAR